MSTVSDYYCPDETPEFRDPTPEEMEANAPAEERMLATVDLLRSAAASCPLANGWLNELEAYFRQAIADRDRDYGHDDPETDPFSYD